MTNDPIPDSSYLTVAQRVNHIRRAWAEGRVAYGVTSRAPGLALNRTLASLQRYGLDFIVLDGEHGNYTDSSNFDTVHAIAALGVSPLVRIPAQGQEAWGIRLALDNGAHGVVVPLVETAEQAADIVSRSKYFPEGTRTSGALFNLPAFHLGEGRTLTGPQYREVANEATLVIPIIETKKGLDNIDDIVKVKGLDAISVGPWDLALSFGGLDVSNPDVQAGVARIHAAAKREGIPVLTWSQAGTAAQHIEDGAKAVVIDDEVGTLTRAYATILGDAGAPERW